MNLSGHWFRERIMSRIASLALCSCAIALSACNRNKTASTDTSAALQAPTPAAGGASAPAQSLAQLAGTWHGKTLAKHRDTTLGTWTFQTTGDTGTLSAGALKLHVHDIHVVGDSIFETMGPFDRHTADHKTQTVTGDVAVQVRGDSAHGRVIYRLTAKPDSVIVQARLVGARGK